MAEQAGSRPTDVGEPDLPALAAEDHVCAGCEMSYAELTIEAVTTVLRGFPRLVRSTLDGIEPALRRRRPEPDVWSVAEYTCHIRDVMATSTLRLHRCRVEDVPRLEPMLADVRAERFSYNFLDLDAVLDELAANSRGLMDEIGQLEGEDWVRTVTRRPEEVRTARWIVRHAVHEGVHHVRDMAAVAAALIRA